MASLDPCQDAAVDTGPVDLFVAAGAGSGKTRVLTARFVAAVLGEGSYRACDPRELLTVTFTEKAAGELADRIRRALGAAGDPDAARALGEAWILTLHGMCARILRQHAFDAGIDPYFRVLDAMETSALEAEAMESAASALLESHPFGAALFDTYGYEVVVTAASDIRASVRALALPISDVRRIGREEALRALRESAAELSALVGQYDQLRPTKTVETNADLARAAAAALEVADESGGDDAWMRLLSELPTRGLRHLASLEGLDELVDATASAIERARSGAAQLLVSEREDAFLALIGLLEARCAELKDARGMLDFADLEIRTFHLLESRPDIALQYRSRFAMLMLDEFQDTNALQARIIEALSANNLCTVGDENQSIYGFRHADVEVFRDRAACVTDHRKLDINYRTAPALLERLNALFSNSALLGPRYMSLRSPEGMDECDATWMGQPRFEARFVDWTEPGGADAQEAEAAAIAERVAEFVSSGVKPGSIAVLMRALAGGRGVKVERALASRGIPALLSSGGTFFECPEVIEARALLGAINNVRDDAVMTVVLAGRLGGLSDDSMVSVRTCADSLARARGVPRGDVHLWDALTSTELHLTEPDEGRVRAVVAAIIDARRRRGLRPLGDTVMAPLQDLDTDLMLFASGPGGARAWSNVLKLARMATEFETATGGDLGGFLRYLALRELHATGEQEATLDGEATTVRIMTIHAAKGLEFPVVIVGGLTGGQGSSAIAAARVNGRPLLGMVLPHCDGKVETLASRSVKDSLKEASEAEAIRLLYVACTRAEQALTVVARTVPAKPADDTLSGLIRRALGYGEASSFEQQGLAEGNGDASVTLVPAVMPDSSAGLSATPTESREGPRQSAHTRADESHEWTGSPTAHTTASSAPRRVSYTGLTTYERCPYRFFLTTVLRLPAPPAAQGGDALAFGTAVHAVLERLRSRDDDVSGLIAAVVSSSGLPRASAVRLGEAVRAFLASPVATEIFAAERVMREVPIAVPIAGSVLAGAIDALAWNGDRALIVDYKTGTAPLSEFDAANRYGLQGACYALAAFGAGASRVRVVFAEVERQRETVFEYGSGDAERMRREVAAIVERANHNEFAPRDCYDRELCETCPGLGGMCSVTRPAGGGAG